MRLMMAYRWQQIVLITDGRQMVVMILLWSLTCGCVCTWTRESHCNYVVCRRVSYETVESPVTAVAHLSIEGNTVIIATQWRDNIRMWTVSSQGFFTPCGSVHGQVLFQTVVLSNGTLLSNKSGSVKEPKHPNDPQLRIVGVCRKCPCIN